MEASFELDEKDRIGIVMSVERAFANCFIHLKIGLFHLCH